MYPHFLPTQTRLMRRRAHQLAYVRPAVPDVYPWPMRFQCCPTLDLAASLAAPAAFSAQAAGGARQPFRKNWKSGRPRAGRELFCDSYRVGSDLHGQNASFLPSANSKWGHEGLAVLSQRAARACRAGFPACLELLARTSVPPLSAARIGTCMNRPHPPFASRWSAIRSPSFPLSGVPIAQRSCRIRAES
jgi:hypothetical protein